MLFVRSKVYTPRMLDDLEHGLIPMAESIETQGNTLRSMVEAIQLCHPGVESQVLSNMEAEAFAAQKVATLQLFIRHRAQRKVAKAIEKRQR